MRLCSLKRWKLKPSNKITYADKRYPLKCWVKIKSSSYCKYIKMFQQALKSDPFQCIPMKEIEFSSEGKKSPTILWLLLRRKDPEIDLLSTTPATSLSACPEHCFSSSKGTYPLWGNTAWSYKLDTIISVSNKGMIVGFFMHIKRSGCYKLEAFPWQMKHSLSSCQ